MRFIFKKTIYEHSLPRIGSEAALIFLLLFLLLLASGCASAPKCAPIEDAYKEALSSEAQLEDRPAASGEESQLGLTVGADLLKKLADDGLSEIFSAQLKHLDEIDVGDDQIITLESDFELKDLLLTPEQSCEDCFKIEASLDGDAALDIPQVGARRSTLGGRLSVVAPLVVERLENGAALKFDLKEAEKLGKSTLEVKLEELPESWDRVLRAALSTRLLEGFLSEDHALPIFSFRADELGIPGLIFEPNSLEIDAETGNIFIGFKSNISNPSVEQLRARPNELKKDENLAISFDPNLVVGALAIMMQRDQLARQYSSDGHPLRDGPARAHIPALEFSKGRYRELPMALGFEIYHAGEKDMTCHQIMGEAKGRIALRPEGIEVSLSDTSILKSTAPQLSSAGSWSQAEFLRATKRIIRNILSEKYIQTAGSALSFRGLSVDLVEGFVVLRGVSTLSKQ